METTLITIATFDNYIDAHLAKSKLLSEGIEVFIFDENIVSLIPLYNITVGGIKVKVKSAEAEKAHHVLTITNDLPYTNENNEILKCPNCHSERIYSGFNSLWSVKGMLGFVLSLLTSNYPIMAEKKYRCKSVGLSLNKGVKTDREITPSGVRYKKQILYFLRFQTKFCRCATLQ